jgi:hypothetical protein
MPSLGPCPRGDLWWSCSFMASGMTSPGLTVVCRVLLALRASSSTSISSDGLVCRPSSAFFHFHEALHHFHSKVIKAVDVPPTPPLGSAVCHVSCLSCPFCSSHSICSTCLGLDWGLSLGLVWTSILDLHLGCESFHLGLRLCWFLLILDDCEESLGEI